MEDASDLPHRNAPRKLLHGSRALESGAAILVLFFPSDISAAKNPKAIVWMFKGSQIPYDCHGSPMAGAGLLGIVQMTEEDP